MTNETIIKISTKKKTAQKLKQRVSNSYYAIDISNIVSSIQAINKFMALHPEFFNTNINKKISHFNDQLINVYLEPVIFKDKLHNFKGNIVSEYNEDIKIFKMIVNIKTNKKKLNNSICYIKQIETYVNNQSKHGDTVQLQYNKILSDVIIKHCYYEKPSNQWIKDIDTLQNEFFLPEKDYLLSIMNNKIDNNNIGSTSNTWNNLILHGSPGTGKCLAKNTPVLMYNGSIKPIQDIVAGDLVMGDDSVERTVLSLAQGKDLMYNIRQGKDLYTVNRSHILSLVYCKFKMFDKNDNNTFSVVWKDNNVTYTKIFSCTNDALLFYNSINTSTYIDISVAKYVTLEPRIKNKLMGYTTEVNFKECFLDKDPYIFALEVISANFNKQDLNASGIPDILKINSKTVRLSVLAAVIDKIGEYDAVCNVYSVKYINMEFTNDLTFICKSLGFKMHTYKNSIILSGQGLWQINTRDMLKRSKVYKLSNNNQCVSISVSVQGIDNYYGFMLDKNKKFVLGNFIVTHNSSFVYRTSMILKLSILSVDLSLYLNKKKDLYALFHGQEFCLPNSTVKEPALNNCIIVLEEFDTSIEKLLDIENIFKYKDILKRNYLDLKNKEIKKKALTLASSANDSEIITPMEVNAGDNYEEFMEKVMLNDGFDTRNNQVLDKARNDILEQRDQGNELNSINTELDNIIKSMDNDNKSNIVRLADLLELFQGPVPIAGRILIATTNHFDKIKKSMPALFRAGRMSDIEFKYLDWATLNKLTQYYFGENMTSMPFNVCIATSQIVELAIKIKLNKQEFVEFQQELEKLCYLKLTKL
jgi:DNA polymerase III delta prime subunit